MNKKGHAATLTNAGKGRPKGTPNKFTSLKDSFVQAFEGIGGTQELIEWAKLPQNRPQFYQMIAKMLPNKQDVTGHEGESAIRQVVIKFVDPRDGKLLDSPYDDGKYLELRKGGSICQ